MFTPEFTSLFATPALLAFAITVLTTPIVIHLYSRFGWLDDPKTNTHAKVTHAQPTPRGGGLPIFISLLTVSLISIGLDKHLLGILAGSSILTLVGTLDDIKDLNPYARLVTGTLAALCVVAAGIGIAYVTNPFGSPGSVIHLNQPQIPIYLWGKLRTIWVLADLFAVLWIVWLMNIVNWSKGLDGQMPGFVAIAAFFLGLLSFNFVGDFTQWPVIKLAAITSGAFLGLLVWNRYPQKIMPGYGGGSLAGFLLAVLAILSGAKLAAMILILGIPIADAIYTIVRRIWNKQSPVWGDRGHLHHHLLDLGWSKPQIARFYWFSTLVLGLLALQLTSSQKLFTILAVGLLVGGLLFWLKLIRQNVIKSP